MSFEAFSNLEESLETISKLHWESGNEAHSKMGYRFKKSMEGALRRKKTNFTTKMVKLERGKRKGKLVRRIVRSGAHSMGERFDRKTGRKLDADMANFIQWRTYSTTGTTIVGGLMKSGTTETRENGKIVGRKKVYGVTKFAVDVLEKISSGRTGRAKWYTRAGKESTRSMKRFEGTHEKHPTYFIREGKLEAMQGHQSKIKNWTRLALAKRVKYAREKMKKVA